MFSNNPTKSYIYTLSLHDALPIYVFPDVEVLDFAGPYEVFTTASRVYKMEMPAAPAPFTVFTVARESGGVRSEEHTSELQSLAYIVCRLLLEKKNHIKHSGHVHEP